MQYTLKIPDGLSPLEAAQFVKNELIQFHRRSSLRCGERANLARSARDKRVALAEALVHSDTVDFLKTLRID